MPYKDPKKQLENAKQWNLEHKIHRQRYLKKYQFKNNEHLKEYHKKWSIENKSWKLEYNRIYKLKNIDKYKTYFREYYKNNIEKIKEYRKKNRYKIKFWGQIGSKKRRELTKDLSIKTIQLVYEDNIKKYGTLTCILCLQPIEFGQDSLEHLIPLSRYGTNNYNNLGISHLSCNKKKYTQTLDEWKKSNESIKFK